MKTGPKELIDLQLAGVQRWRLHLFEEIIKAIYVHILDPGDKVVDGGANAGLHTIPLARHVGQDGQVIAFEPIPDLASALGKKVADLGLKNVQIREEALARNRGRSRFFRLRNREAESSLIAPAMDMQTDELDLMEVQTVRLDDLVPSLLDRWRFAKLDLEGAEFDALRGGKECLMNFRPTVILEFGYHATAATWGYDQEEWDQFFDDIGYRLYDLAGRPILYRPWGELGSWIWYLIAVPKGSADESFVLDGMGETIEPVVKEWAAALDEGRLPRMGESV